MTLNGYASNGVELRVAIINMSSTTITNGACTPTSKTTAVNLGNVATEEINTSGSKPGLKPIDFSLSYPSAIAVNFKLDPAFGVANSTKWCY